LSIGICMLKALAIETSGRVGSVALAEGGGVVVESEFPHGLKHAAGMIPIIEGLCRERGWLAADLREVYVSAGPGSFTGLRIGITVAKALALATGAKIVAVPSVRVLAENAPAEAGHVIVVLDAKREQIFTARFERCGGTWIEREAAHLDSLVGMVGRSPRPVYLIGEGIPFHQKYICGGDSSILLTGEGAWRASAGVVARLGMEMGRKGQFADPYRLIPIYIRAPEAEEKRVAAEEAGKEK